MSNFSGVIKSSKPMKFKGQGKTGAAQVKRAAKKKGEKRTK